MFSRFRISQLHRFRNTVLAFAVVIGTAACGDDPVEVEEEPEVATMRILVGTQTINVNVANCTVTGGPITLAAGTTAFSVQFLLANGQPEPLVTGTTFRADVTPTNAGVVTFARTGPFAGALTRVAAGSTTVKFALFHLEEGHNEFDCNVALTAT